MLPQGIEPRLTDDQIAYVLTLVRLLRAPNEDIEAIERIKSELRNSRCWPDIMTHLENYLGQTEKSPAGD